MTHEAVEVGAVLKAAMEQAEASIERGVQKEWTESYRRFSAIAWENRDIISSALDGYTDILSDANTVHVNMLKGTIAKPSVSQIIHIYGEDALRAGIGSKDD